MGQHIAFKCPHCAQQISGPAPAVKYVVGQKWDIVCPACQSPVMLVGQTHGFFPLKSDCPLPPPLPDEQLASAVEFNCPHCQQKHTATPMPSPSKREVVCDACKEPITLFWLTNNLLPMKGYFPNRPTAQDPFPLHTPKEQLISVTEDCQVFARWGNEAERKEARDQLEQIKDETTASLKAVKEKQRHLEMQFKGGSRSTGPMIWGGGKAGSLIHLAQLVGRVAVATSYNSQMEPIETQRHKLEILLINTKKILKDIGGKAVSRRRRLSN